MAGEAEQITGVIPVVVTGGVVMGFAKGMQDMYSGKPRRRGKKSSRKYASPWSGNPMAGGKPW